MFHKYLLPFLLSIIISWNCSSQNSASAGILFYNVENLFDTLDTPNKIDEEFTPGSEKKWNTERYKQKIDHLGEVIRAAGGENLPAIIGMCEIENASVLDDLAHSNKLMAGNYNFIHYESPDERGIDCALLYNTKLFTPVKSVPVKVELPEDNGGTTRDILFVEGDLKIKNKSEHIFLLINHWPSRVEGEEITASRRAIAAGVLKHLVDSLNQKYSDPHIVIMGDFNDTPFDKSIQSVLGAIELIASQKDECLVDLMTEFQKQNQGSYNFKGNWQCLDQFIVSESMIDGKKLGVNTGTVTYVKKDFMLYHNEKYGDSPNKTYSGSKYFGGYSDHLPIYMELTVK